MEQARVRAKGTLHHSVDVVESILGKNIVRQGIDRVDQLIRDAAR